MKKQTGGPAFPTSDWDENDKAYKMHGMTLRDYFAAKAIVGQFSNGGWKSDQSHFDDIAEGAYRLADAMMEARK